MADKKRTPVKSTGKKDATNKPMSKKKKKRVAIIAAEVAVIIIALIVAAILIISDKLNTVKGVGDDGSVIADKVDKDEIVINPDLQDDNMKGYWTLAAFGVDSRTGMLGKGTLSDTIIIVSINKETSEVKMASVYRDTYLDIGGGTYRKANAAYSAGGPQQAIDMLNKNLDLNITEFATVNWNVLVEIIDKLGGIEVEVADKEATAVNKYLQETANSAGVKANYLSGGGTLTLDGAQAVTYCRIRKGVGDDFKRTERMRTVLELVFEKVKTMSFSEVKDLIDLLTPQVRTNLKTNDILALGIRLPNFNITGSVSWPYDVTTGLIGGVSYVLPADLAANATQLHQEMFMQEDYVPSDSLYATSNEIAARIQAARDNHEIEDEKKVESSSKDSEKDSDDSSSKSSSSTSDSKNTDKDDSKSSSSGNNVDKDTNSSDSSSDKSTDKSDQSDKSSSSENTDDTGNADTDTETDTSTDTDTSGEDTTTDTDASDDKDDSSEADTPDVPEDSEDSDPDVPTDGETTDSEEAA